MSILPRPSLRIKDYRRDVPPDQRSAKPRGRLAAFLARLRGHFGLAPAPTPAADLYRRILAAREATWAHRDAHPRTFFDPNAPTLATAENRRDEAENGRLDHVEFDLCAELEELIATACGTTAADLERVLQIDCRERWARPRRNWEPLAVLREGPLLFLLVAGEHDDDLTTIVLSA